MDDERGAISAFLRTLDDAWDHRWESLTAVLDGVTDEEAQWQHAAYADEAREEGWPLPGSIAWHVAHVAHCKRYYTKIVVARGSDATTDVDPRSPCETFAEELGALEEAHKLQRAAIASVTDDEMHFGVGTHTPMALAEFLAMSIRHDAWHGGQIAVLRRLYRSR